MITQSLSPSIVFFSLIGGFMPALFWLFFWLREDKLKPEPRSLIMLSFFSGMISVVLALFIEKAIKNNVSDSVTLLAFYAPIVEEILKFLGAYFSALRKKDNDEPIDPTIYLITSALGFAALENVLFLVNPLSENDMLASIATGDLRFMGASLLHVLASASIGIFIGFSFYKKRVFKYLLTFIGLITAITLHSFFNFFIISGNENSFRAIFGGLWLAVIILMFILEKIKRIGNR